MGQNMDQNTCGLPVDEKEVVSPKVLLFNADSECHYDSKDDHYLHQGMADVFNMQTDQAIKQTLTGYLKSVE